MFKSKWILSTSLAVSAVMSAGVTLSAHASQYVADLVHSEWKEIARAVEVRQKMHSSNLYGNSAELQMMFLNNGSPALFDMTQLSVNSDSFSCRLPAGEDLGSLNSAYTQICRFEPKLLLTTPDSLEAVRDYWMRVKF